MAKDNPYLKEFKITEEVKVSVQKPNRSSLADDESIKSIRSIFRLVDEIILDARKIRKSGTFEEIFSSLGRPIKSIVMGKQEILQYSSICSKARQTGRMSVEILNLGHVNPTYALAIQDDILVVVEMKRMSRYGFMPVLNIINDLNQHAVVGKGAYTSKIIFPCV